MIAGGMGPVDPLKTTAGKLFGSFYAIYSGLFLITLGFLVQWPSVLTLVMWPILMWTYYRLAMQEEQEVEQQFGKAYLDYKKRVPIFIPKFWKGGTQ